MLATSVARTAEDIYDALADIVISDIHDEWETATIHAVVHDEEYVTFQGLYTPAHRRVPSTTANTGHTVQSDDEVDPAVHNLATEDAREKANDSAELSAVSSANQGKHRVSYFRTQSDVYDLILDLRRILQRAGTEPFDAVDFTVSRDGRYDLSFSYPNCTPLSDGELHADNTPLIDKE